MIEISHKQARYLIREIEDRRLPDEQWAALQAHLEGCPECRAHQARMGVLGRDLRRVLHQHWNQVGSPTADLPRQVLAQRAARRRRSRRVLVALSGLLFLMAVVGLQWKTQVFSPAPTSTPVIVLPSLTPTPQLRFRGLVLFENNQTGSANGNADIFLLNSTGSSTPDLSNLTKSPAQDSDPIWSPDGEWIAFLSDRTGKREVYVISVAGTRLTQITAESGIDWQGPLSWSADGHWIALIGRRLAQNGDRWGYLVPITGGVAVSLPGTRNMAEKMLFSPNQPLLATARSVYNIADGWSFDGWYGLATEEGAFDDGRTAGPQGAFDWALGGGSLAYLAQGQVSQGNGALADQIRLSPVIGPNYREIFVDKVSHIIDRASGGTAFRSISSMPGGSLLGTLQDSHNTSCWTVHLVNAINNNQTAPSDMPGLCVDGNLERASWDSKGASKTRWLAVAGRLADPGTGKPVGEPGIYAIRNSPLGYSAAPEIERLVGLPADLVTVPRLRPSAESLHIQPQAAGPIESPRIQSLPPLAVTESMLMAEQDAELSQGFAITRMGADGVSVVLVPDDTHNDCPTWSPDGQKIAYWSYKEYPSGIFLMDADGGNQSLAIPKAQPVVGGLAPAYGCPVWSPDGKVMAALRYEGDVPRLAVIGREEGVLGIFPIDSPSERVRPVWSPDSKTIYLAETIGRNRSVTLVSIHWSTLTGPVTMRVLSGWDDVQAMAIAPDGRQLALIATQTDPNTQMEHANLFILDLIVPGAGMRKSLPDYTFPTPEATGRIVWLPDGRLLFAFVQYDLLTHDKASFVTFNPKDGLMDTLAFSEDALIDWAVKDGWLIYSSESGLWAQNVSGDSDFAPVRLSSQRILSLELK